MRLDIGDATPCESCSLAGVRRQNPVAARARMLCEPIETVSVDNDGEIYVVGYEGTIFRLDLSVTKFE